MQHAVGQRIRELRRARGLTQEAVAERAQINAKYFGSIERGEVNVTVQTIARIADALAVPAGELFSPVTESGSDRKRLMSQLQELVANANDETVQRLVVFFERVFR
jgi:transcriptional regulator with XRE-family HTH domain